MKTSTTALTKTQKFNELFDVQETMLNIGFLYKNSIIPLGELYENFITMSVKTSNSQKTIDKMPYWKFIVLSKTLAKHIEAENKPQNGESSVEEQSNTMMANAKNSLPNMKPPKMSKPKFKQ